MSSAAITDDGRLLVSTKDASTGGSRFFTIVAGRVSPAGTLEGFAVNRLQTLERGPAERFIAGGNDAHGYAVRVLRRDGETFVTEWDSRRLAYAKESPASYTISADGRTWASLRRVDAASLQLLAGSVPSYQPFASLTITTESKGAPPCECAEEVHILNAKANGATIAVLASGIIRLYEVGGPGGRSAVLVADGDQLQHLVTGHPSGAVWAHGSRGWYRFETNASLQADRRVSKPTQTLENANDLEALSDGSLLVRRSEEANGKRLQRIEFRGPDGNRVMETRSFDSRTNIVTNRSGRTLVVVPAVRGSGRIEIHHR